MTPLDKVNVYTAHRLGILDSVQRNAILHGGEHSRRESLLKPIGSEIAETDGAKYLRSLANEMRENYGLSVEAGRLEVIADELQAARRDLACHRQSKEEARRDINRLLDQPIEGA